MEHISNRSFRCLRQRERLRPHCSRSGFYQKKYGRGVDVEAAVHLRRVEQDQVDYIRVYRVAPLLAARRAEVREGHAGFFMKTFKDDIGEFSQTHNTFRYRGIGRGATAGKGF